MSVRRFFESRAPVIAAAAALAIGLAVGYLIFGNMRQAWHIVLVQSGSASFVDLRAITASVDCARNGIDPYAVICDAFGRPFNYPPAWLLLRYLGVTYGASAALGWGLIAVTFMVFLLLFRPVTTRTRWAAFFTILSPPVLLGMERGNGDLLLFDMVALAFYSAVRLPERARIIIQFMATAVGTLLKIYPLAAAAAIVRRPRQYYVATAVAVLSACLLFVTSWREIGFVFRNTPTTTSYSFGNLPVFLELSRFFWLGLAVKLDTLRLIADGITVAVMAAALTGAWHIERRRPGTFPVFDPGDPIDNVALACLSIFCFVFCLGASYDYRLIFVAGLMPALLREYERSKRPYVASAIVAILLFLWSCPGSQWIWPAFEALEWTVFAAAVAWLGVTISRRIGMAGRLRTT